MKRTSIFAASLMCSVMLSAQTKETAVLFSGTELDNSYLLTEKVSVTFDSEGKGAIYAGETKVGDFDVTSTVTAEFKNAFKLKANQDPDNKENYYSTFFTSEGAYKVPEGTQAFAGEVKNGEDIDVLKLTDIGNLIHTSEAVILRAGTGEITLMPSGNTATASAEDDLDGVDEATTLGAGDYALSLGQNGVGFYLWENKNIGANKAYLSLGTSSTNALTFQFDNGADAIHNAEFIMHNGDENIYNLNGMRVNDDYKGIVIRNGKKILKK